MARRRGPTELRPLPEDTPPVPRAVTRSSRMPLDARLEVRQGSLPADLQGHLFFMVPAGTVEDGPVAGPGNPILSGEGMIYRVDLDRPGEAHVKVRPANPPCRVADAATRVSEVAGYGRLRFGNFGLGRLSLALGMRNLLNTALVPATFPGERRGRLLVTTDDGRPYEIDPDTLATVTPVGALNQWRHLIGDGTSIGPLTFGSMPFPLIMSTAHPVYDGRTRELFSVNYGRSQVSLLRAMTELNQAVDTLGDALRILLGRWLSLALFYLLAFPVWIMGLLRRLWYGVDDEDYTYLVRWRGDEELERWSLRLPDGSPLMIQQTLHQMACTRDYLVLLDASFKFAPDQLFNTIHPFQRDNKWLEQMVRRLFTGPQMPETRLYIVRRSDLQGGQVTRPDAPPAGDPPPVVARMVTIEPEALHFLADYENPDDRITLHLVHNNAACLAEWLREYDTSAYPPHAPVPADLLGLIAVGQTDISRLGRYVIDAARGLLLDGRQVSSVSSPNTFNVSLYAYRETDPDGAPAARLTQIYWTTGGYWPELLTEFIWNLYRDYSHRTIPLDEFQAVTGDYQPNVLLRLDTAAMELRDHYTFDERHLGLSPQFVPRRRDAPAPAGVDPATDGYIAVTVVSDAGGSELWLFDAADLRAPVCVLGHPEMVFGVTIHTAWTPEALPREAAYRVDVRADFGPRVRKAGSRLIAQLFEQEIYPRF